MASGWCKVQGSNTYAGGYSELECSEAKGQWSPTDPSATKTDPIGDPPGCFVATAAYGTPLAPEVDQLRNFKNEVLMKTRGGARFFEEFYSRYEQISPLLVSVMEADPKLRSLVRWIVVTPIVVQLETMLRFPDVSLDGVPEPWKSFLAQTRSGLENWAEAIELSEDFSGLSAMQVADELAIVLRYLLRTDESRAAYLDRLAAKGQIPLHAGKDELAQAAGRLRESGRSAADIERILGVPA